MLCVSIENVRDVFETLCIYTVRHKNTSKFVDHNLKVDYRILIIFGTIMLLRYLGNQNT